MPPIGVDPAPARKPAATSGTVPAPASPSATSASIAAITSSAPGTMTNREPCRSMNRATEGPVIPSPIV